MKHSNTTVSSSKLQFAELIKGALLYRQLNYNVLIWENSSNESDVTNLKLKENAEMKKILVTGGTVFVSRYIAEYYVTKGYDVYVLSLIHI